MRYSLIDKALPDISSGLILRRRPASKLRLFLYSFRGISQQVIWEACSHEASTCQRQGHATGIYGYPAPAPLLRHVSRGAAATGRIKNKVTEYLKGNGETRIETYLSWASDNGIAATLAENVLGELLNDGMLKDSEEHDVLTFRG